MAQRKGEIKIRKMVDTDIPKVNHLDNLLFRAQRGHIWPFSFETYWAMYHPPLSFVADVGGDIVGFVAGMIAPEEHSRSIIGLRRVGDSTARNRQVGWIDFVGIHPDYQHRGVGRGLVEAFGAECKRNNAEMRTRARESNEAMKNFLAGVGFRKSSLITYVKD